MAPARSSSENWLWPVIWAVALHIVILVLLLVSWAVAPDLPPPAPVVQVTLYELNSKSQAVEKTRQHIAGEAEKTKARQYEEEQQAQQRIASQKAIEEAKRKAAEEKKRKAEEDAKRKAAEIARQKQAEEAKRKAAEEKKRKEAEEQKRKAAEEKKRKEVEEAKRKAAEIAKRKEAEEQKRKAEDEAKRKAEEEKKAQALAELLSDQVQRKQTLADQTSPVTAGNIADLLKRLVSNEWLRPPSARNGMVVQVRIEMLPDGTITQVNVAQSSGDLPFDRSAVAAVLRVGRVPEMQKLTAVEFQPYRKFIMTFTPEDLEQ